MQFLCVTSSLTLAPRNNHQVRCPRVSVSFCYHWWAINASSLSISIEIYISRKYLQAATQCALCFTSCKFVWPFEVPHKAIDVNSMQKKHHPNNLNKLLPWSKAHNNCCWIICPYSLCANYLTWEHLAAYQYIKTTTLSTEYFDFTMIPDTWDRFQVTV